MTVKANIEKAKNGYIIHIYREGKLDVKNTGKTDTFICKTADEVATIIKKEIK